MIFKWLFGTLESYFCTSSPIINLTREEDHMVSKTSAWGRIAIISNY